MAIWWKKQDIWRYDHRNGAVVVGRIKQDIWQYDHRNFEIVMALQRRELDSGEWRYDERTMTEWMVITWNHNSGEYLNGYRNDSNYLWKQERKKIAFERWLIAFFRASFELITMSYLAPFRLYSSITVYLPGSRAVLVTSDRLIRCVLSFCSQVIIWIITHYLLFFFPNK